MSASRTRSKQEKYRKEKNCLATGHVEFGESYRLSLAVIGVFFLNYSMSRG